MITKEDIERLFEESENWYGYIPKGYMKGKLQDFFKEFEKLDAISTNDTKDGGKE